MQHSLSGPHFRSSSFVIVRASRIGEGHLPATHATNSLHAVQVAILYHYRLQFGHSNSGIWSVTGVHYQSPLVDDEVRGQTPQAQYSVLSMWVAIFELHLSYLGQKAAVWGAHVDAVDTSAICRKGLGIEAACVVFGASLASRRY